MRNGPYELVKAPANFPGKKYRGKYCYEHQLVYWKHTGVVPKRNELIHHKDDNKRHNVFSNLDLKTKSNHSKGHAVLSNITTVCKFCNKTLVLKGNDFNKRSKNRMGVFCNRSHAALYQFNIPR